MKHIFTLFALVISLSAFAQNSNLIIFNNSGQQFFVVLNGIRQNSMPKTNVKIEGLAPVSYKVKIIFADGRTGDIDKNIYLEPNMEYSAQVVIKSAKKRSLRLFDLVELNTSPYGVGSETVTYRPNDGAAYSDQQQTAQTQTYQTSGQVQQTGTTGNVQATGTTNQSGTVQTSAGMNGQPQVNTTVTTTGNNGAQGGNVQTNIGMNGQPQVSTGVTTSGSATGNTQTGNVQMNVGMNGMPNGGINQNVVITENGENVVLDMQVSGMPTGMNGTTMTTTSNGTQITTTTANGQTTQVTSNVSGNGMNGQAGVNTSVTGTGINGQAGTTMSGTGLNGQASTTVTGTNGQVVTNGTQTTTTTTTVNGQTTQVTTTVNGTGMNGQANGNGTHTHADGTVHDHNHNPVNGGTHTHADGTVHDQNHKPVSSGNIAGDAIVNANGTVTCKSSVKDVDMLVSGIKQESFSSDQMDLVRTTLKTKCINSDQAYRIVNSFTFDGDKIEMAKFCYDHMTDRNNASKLLDLFTYSSSKDELRKYFSK